MKPLVFVFDPKRAELDQYKTILQQDSKEVRDFADASEFLEAFRRELPDLVLANLDPTDRSSHEVINAVHRRSPEIAVVFTAENPRGAQALRLGADDYLRKPFVAEELCLMVNKMLEVARVRQQLNEIQQLDRQRHSVASLLGESPAITELRAFLQQAAASPNDNVLLTGECGTGKNLAARAIHYGGVDAAQAYVEVNCAAIPHQLSEAELFGHEEEVSVEARTSRRGLFERADGGTILFDEVNSSSASVQTKLLSFLESHSFRRVGGAGTITVRARVVSTTNTDLESAVSKKTFRRDLYDRIRTLSTMVPSLRDRGEDVLVIANAFIEQFNLQMNKRVLALSEAAREKILHYRWPGNVRQLRNVIERAMILSDRAELGVDDLAIGENGTNGNNNFPNEMPRSLLDLEKDHIVRVLSYTKRDTVRASEILGISRKNLWEKRKKYHLDELVS